MDYIQKYKDRYLKNKHLDKTKVDNLVMLNMIIVKLRSSHNLKSIRQFAKYIGYDYNHLTKILRGERPITKYLLTTICFAGGLNTNSLQGVFEKREVDEYINSSGHLIIDGVDYGRVIE